MNFEMYGSGLNVLINPRAIIAAEEHETVMERTDGTETVFPYVTIHTKCGKFDVKDLERTVLFRINKWAMRRRCEDKL